MVSPISEFESLIALGGYFKPDDFAILQLAGPDAKKFLQNYTTNDVNLLANGQAQFTCFLNRKGTLVATALLWKINEHDYLFLLEAAKLAALSEHLKTFLLFSDCELKDLSCSYDYFIVIGPKEIPSPNLGHVSEYYQLRTGQILIPKNESQVFESSLELNLHTLLTLNDLRVWAAIPKDGVDIRDAQLVHEMGLDLSHVNFNKGCYLGQETVARVQSRGHVNKIFAQLELSAPCNRATPIDVLLNDKMVGQMTSLASYRKQLPLALGSIKLDALSQIKQCQLAGLYDIKLDLKKRAPD